MSHEDVLQALVERIERRLDFIVKIEILQSIIIALILAWLFSIEARVGFAFKQPTAQPSIVIDQSLSGDLKSNATNKTFSNKHASNNVENVKGVSIKNSGNTK